MKNFLKGFGSVFDLAGSSAPASKLGTFEDDKNAIGGDWRAVGDDVRKVLGDIDSSTAVSTAKKGIDIAGTAVATAGKFVFWMKAISILLALLIGAIIGAIVMSFL